MSERVFVHGDIWEDKDEDEWEYDGRNGCFAPHPGGVASLKPEFVEERWGPLVLKKPAEDNYTEVAMADWEKELLENRFKTNPHVPDNAVYLDPSDVNFYGNADSKNYLPVFGISEDVFEKVGTDFIEKAVDTYEEALALLLKKNADYGSKNIAESPGGALNGLRVRMWDKMARINNLLDSGAEPENESLRDSFLDLGNYCFIALMVLDGNWPGGKGEE